MYVQIARSFATWTGHTKEILGFKERGFKYQNWKINFENEDDDDDDDDDDDNYF